jgi:hypothetical protein
MAPDDWLEKEISSASGLWLENEKPASQKTGSEISTVFWIESVQPTAKTASSTI